MYSKNKKQQAAIAVSKKNKAKSNIKTKYKGFSKLPEAVQKKINKKLAKKV